MNEATRNAKEKGVLKDWTVIEDEFVRREVRNKEKT